MRARLRPIMAALALCLAAAAPSDAAGPAQEQFKTEIDGFLDKLAASSNGVVTWDGADGVVYRQEGDAVVAVFINARLSINAQQSAQVVFDRIEIRRAPAPGGGDAVRLAVVFPSQSTLTTADGSKIKLGFEGATASATLDEPSGRVRETMMAFAGARLEYQPTGDWISFGPLSFSSKLVGAADGSWAAPIEFELKQIEFFLTETPVGGAIDRIAYNASSAGPDIAGLDRLRDRIDALRQQGERPPAARLEALLELLPAMPALFSVAKGELTVDGVAVRAPTGEPLFALAKASLGGALTGLSGDNAALRITLRQDGFTLAAALLDPSKVPQRVVVDFGLENVGTAPLRSILEAAGKLGEGATEAESQQARQRMMAAAAMLNPVFRIYEMALDTKDVGVAATAQAQGSPLAPKGYTAAGDVTVRGFDALPDLVADAPYAEYLPLLKVLGTAADDGAPIKFHLASAPQKWITINGNDVSAWLLDEEPPPGQPRALRPAQPAMQGNDARAVQRALAAADSAVPQNGLYDGATAAAVARFQKRNGLNADGVINAATRQKLGLKPEPAQPRGPGQPPSRSN